MMSMWLCQTSLELDAFDLEDALTTAEGLYVFCRYEGIYCKEPSGSVNGWKAVIQEMLLAVMMIQIMYTIRPRAWFMSALSEPSYEEMGWTCMPSIHRILMIFRGA